ncbi:hypothetical protein U9M48_023760 [Paspalum notatum var. saurae]|uniref:Uncharacterized protein n=1 Tax=Paspalum notatum var. saurae TaxID=547442 RepID=A0AAQ3TP57_PASNO
MIGIGPGPVWENRHAPPSVKVSSPAGVRNEDARVQPKPEAHDIAEPEFLAEGQAVSATTNITTLAILNLPVFITIHFPGFDTPHPPVGTRWNRLADKSDNEGAIWWTGGYSGWCLEYSSRSLDFGCARHAGM